MEIMTQDYARQHIKELEAICQTRINPNAIGELASCYFTLGDSEKALPLARRAWEWNRKESGLATNLAMVLKDLGQHEESFKVLEHAYSINPDDFYIRLGYAEALLKAGFWKQAWPIYDNARPTQQAAAMELMLPAHVREWNGETLPDGHKLIILNEGGTGDRISYARWLPELTKRGVDWVFYPYAELFPFFETIFPREKLVADGENITATHWATTFSLPAKLNVGPTEIPNPLPIVASPESIAKYPITRVDKLPVIGLCYHAAELYQGGRKVRSLTEGQAMRLVCMTGDKVHWINLQFGENMPYPVQNVGMDNWQDTAGLIHNLDAVVTVDTGVMHLAGALKKPMAVLLSANSCWKFLKNRKKLPLYPSATFYRNEGHGKGFEHAVTELILDIRSEKFPA